MSAFGIIILGMVLMEKLKVISDIRSHIGFKAFMTKCNELGYYNNSTIERFRFDRVDNNWGNIWGLAKGNDLIATAGCHLFEEYDSDSFRLQFRGCEIPGTDVKRGLSKGHWNSMTWRELIPYELDLAYKVGIYKFYITTNTDNRNHRTMTNMAKQGYLELDKITMLNNTEQAIWRFNDEKYLEVRSKLPIYTMEPPPLI